MSDDAIRTIEYKGHTIEILADENPSSPREDDNICVFYIGHSRYSFGDENYNEPEELKAAIRKAKRDGDIILPLYMYDHSGITISLTPYNDRWDSMQVGFVSAPRKKMIDEFGNKIFTAKLKKRAKEIIESEVNTMDDYLTGNVYGYVIDGNGDSCWGFYGDIDHPDYGIIIEAKGSVNFLVEYEKQKALLFEGIRIWSQKQHLTDTEITNLLLQEPSVNGLVHVEKLLEEYRTKRIEEMAKALRKRCDGISLRKIEKLSIVEQL